MGCFRYLLIIPLLLSCLFSYGQVKALPDKPIDVDNFTGRLPFDVSIKFRKEYKGETEVLFVGVTEVDEKGCPVKREFTNKEYENMQLYIRAIYRNTSTTYLEKVFPKRGSISLQAPFISKFEKGKTTLDFTVPPLSINRNYAIQIVTKPSTGNVEELINLGKLNISDSSKYYQAFGYVSSPDAVGCNLSNRPFLFREFILQFKPVIEKFNTDFAAHLATASATSCAAITEKETEELVKNLVHCNSCRNAYSFLLRPDSLNLFLQSVRNLTDDKLLKSSILPGLLPLTVSSLGIDEPLKAEEISGRINMFVSSRNSFYEVLEVVRIMRLTQPSPALDNLYQKLVAQQACFDLYANKFEVIAADLKRLIKLFSSNTFFASILSIQAETVIYKFDTRNEYSFTPDFGLVYYGEKLNNQFAPYLGCHINLRYVDRDIPWRLYPNKTLLHHLSFHLGTTLISLKKEGRTDNFLKNSGLMTGGSWRFNHVVRLNAGAMWFNREAIDPLIDNKRLSATPYIGVSFDLSVKSFLNGFNTFFN